MIIIVFVHNLVSHILLRIVSLFLLELGFSLCIYIY